MDSVWKQYKLKATQPACAGTALDSPPGQAGTGEIAATPTRLSLKFSQGSDARLVGRAEITSNRLRFGLRLPRTSLVFREAKVLSK
jgi:hypothetical protein